MACAACDVNILVFFFSSRRRHTRCYRDWSSDVCSSDLLLRLQILSFLEQSGKTDSSVSFTKAASLLSRLATAGVASRSIMYSSLAGYLDRSSIKGGTIIPSRVYAVIPLILMKT